MADVTLDTSNADQANPSFNWLTDPTHTAQDILNEEQYNPNSDQSLNFGQQMVKNIPHALKSASNSKAEDPYAGLAQGAMASFSRQATVGNYEQGRERVGLETTKPATKARPPVSENPNEVYRRWYYDSKAFAYGGK